MREIKFRGFSTDTDQWVSLYSSSGCIGNWREPGSDVLYPTSGLDFDVAPRPIDWEQRRYEIASNYTTQMSTSFMGNPDVSELSKEQINYAISVFCASSIKIADELIRQLKGGNQ
ncbi:MAG: hypothetical protein SNH27_07480 [Rikenellaceae bacterium]